MIDTLLKNMKTKVNAQILDKALKATQSQKQNRPKRFVMVAFDQAQ